MIALHIETLCLVALIYMIVFLLLYPTTPGERLINLLFTLDCFVFSVCTLGQAWPGESFSSAAWRAETKGLWYARARPLIDALFFFQPNHCYLAWLSATKQWNLPEDMRGEPGQT